MCIVIIQYCSGDGKKSVCMFIQMHVLKECFNLRMVGSAVEEVGGGGNCIWHQ